MKIALFVMNHFPRKGGSENYAENFAKCLASENEVYLIALGETNQKFTEKKPFFNFTLISVPRSLDFKGIFGLPKLSSLRYLWKLMDTLDFDFYVAFTRFFSTSLISYLHSRKKRKPFYLVELGGGYVRTQQKIIDFLAFIYDQIIGKHLYKHADLVFALTRKSQSFIKDLSNREAVIIGPGVDVEFWQEIGEMSIKFDKSKRHFSFVGRATPEKGLNTILEIFRCQSESLKSETQIHIASFGEEINLIKKQVEVWDHTKSIIFYLDPSKITLREIYQNTILLNPSTASEGLQSVVLESLASGGTVISNNLPGLEELFLELNVGQVIKNKEEWNFVYQTDLFDSNFENQLRDSIFNYSWENLTKRFVRFVLEKSE